jgi:hypothetical protein
MWGIAGDSYRFLEEYYVTNRGVVSQTRSQNKSCSSFAEDGGDTQDGK